MRELILWTCRCGVRYKAATERTKSANQRSLVICPACRDATCLQSTLVYYLWRIGIGVDDTSESETELPLATHGRR